MRRLWLRLSQSQDKFSWWLDAGRWRGRWYWNSKNSIVCASLILLIYALQIRFFYSFSFSSVARRKRQWTGDQDRRQRTGRGIITTIIIIIIIGSKETDKIKAGPKSFAFHFVWLTVSVCGRGSEFNGRHGCQMWWICARHRHWQNKGKNHGKTNSSNNTASDLNFLTTRGAFHLFSLFLFYSGTQL